MSDSSWLHGLQPTRLLPPWDFPGKSTGVGCHRLQSPTYSLYFPTFLLSCSCLSVTIVIQSLSRVRLFATPWTLAHQALLSMGFSRQEYRSGLPFPSPVQPWFNLAKVITNNNQKTLLFDVNHIDIFLVFHIIPPWPCCATWEILVSQLQIKPRAWQ